MPRRISRRSTSGSGWAAALCAGGLVLALTTSASAQVRWRTGVAPRSGKTQAEAVATLSAVQQRSAERHFIVQFADSLSDARRAELAAAGLNLLSYLGDNAYFASVAPAGVDAAALSSDSALIDAQSIQRAWRLHPVLADQQTPEWAVVAAPPEAGEVDPQDTWIAAYVLFHPDVPAGEAWATAVENGAIVRQQLFTVHGAVVELPLWAVESLALNDAVQYIEPALPQMTAGNAENRVLTGADQVNAAPYNLTGNGVTVLVYDGGTARSTHVDFEGRLTVRDSSGQSDHPTHVACTIGGGGVANSSNRGMAPDVTLESYGLQTSGTGVFLYTNPGDIETDFNQAINTYGAVISNASIGTNTAPNGFPCSYEGDYGVTDTVIDAIVRGSLGDPFRMIWANGNERQGTSPRCGATYHTTAPPSCAKNHITVGAVNANDDSMTSFSSWGPADDDRLKPDISAPGCQSNGDGGVTSCVATSNTAYDSYCGTSMATPTVTGCSALLIQDYKVQYPARPLFRNSTLKAWLAHSAVDRGNTGPDYQFGYGSVRIKEAIDLMRSGTFVERTVVQGAAYTLSYTVAAGDPELKVTLAWDDPPGTPNVSPALVNDLDLRVFSPSGTQYYPWTLGGLANPSAAAVRTQANHIDNLEQVLVNNPQAGTWTIQVYGYNVPQGPQAFSIVGDIVGTTIQLPDGPLETIAPGAPATLNVQIASFGETIVPGTAQLHYRFDGGAYQTAPLSLVAGELYSATIPAASCGDEPEYYVSVTGSTSGTLTSPANAPTQAYSAPVGTYQPFFADDMESDRGWTVGDTGDNATTGLWGRNDPQATTAQPEDDHTPAPGVNCFVTDYRAGSSPGTYDVDGGKTTLKSPTFNLSGTTRARIGYWRWYSNDKGSNAGANVFPIDISNNNGASWVNVETVGPTGLESTGGWLYHEFEVSKFVAPTSQMKVRFVAQDIGAGALIEAAVDDFFVERFECVATESCTDGVLNQGETRIDCGGPCAPCACTNNAACSDGLYCNGVETCDASGECQPGATVVCLDAIACTLDFCDEVTDSCVHFPEDGFCNNGQYCDGVETCSASAGCQPGVAPCVGSGWCSESGDVCLAYGDGDFNTDGRVDLRDFSFFQGCYGTLEGAGCTAGNMIGATGAIDANDLQAFINALTGP